MLIAPTGQFFMSQRGRGCQVNLNLQVPDPQPSLKGYLDRHLARIARLAGVRAGNITVAVVGDRQMTDLHAQFLGQRRTTDVLTFDLREQTADTSAPLDGDIVVCFDEASRQVQRRGHAVQDELLLYAVHGLLHLLGYDDHTAAQARTMHNRENELLTAAGLKPIYATGGADVD